MKLFSDRGASPRRTPHRRSLAGAPTPHSAPAGAPAARSNRPHYLLFYWAPVVLCMGVIFVGSSIPDLQGIPGGFSDKTAHGSEYAVLGFLMARALSGPRWLSITWPYVVGAIVLSALYGVSDEFHQRFVPGRDYDVHDMMADATGASISAGALWLCGLIRRSAAARGKPRFSNANKG